MSQNHSEMRFSA